MIRFTLRTLLSPNDEERDRILIHAGALRAKLVTAVELALATADIALGEQLDRILGGDDDDDGGAT